MHVGALAGHLVDQRAYKRMTRRLLDPAAGNCGFIALGEEGAWSWMLTQARFLLRINIMGGLRERGRSFFFP